MKFLRTLSFPFSFMYWIAIVMRNKLYDWKLFNSRNFDVPTICVGNLNVGGTGKSPTVEYLIRLLKDQFQLATLSRGYGRKTKGYIEASALSSPEEIGDEPTQFKQKFNEVKVTVCEERSFALEKLEREVDVVIMDDAFQHRKVHSGLNIVLFDYNKIFDKDWMLPFGNLREPMSGIRRAQIILVTKTPKIFSPMERRRVESHLPSHDGIQVVFSYLSYGKLSSFHTKHPDRNIEELDKKTQVFLITGIADPKLLINHLEAMKLKISKHFNFSDHYNFSINDIDKIKKEYDACISENKIIITTEKDAVRLMHPKFENKLDELPIYYLPIESDIHEKDKSWFDNTIVEYVRSGKKHNTLHS